MSHRPLFSNSRELDNSVTMEKIGETMANISELKNEQAKAVRLSTVEAICKALECQPGNVLEYKK